MPPTFTPARSDCPRPGSKATPPALALGREGTHLSTWGSNWLLSSKRSDSTLLERMAQPRMHEHPIASVPNLTYLLPLSGHMNDMAPAPIDPQKGVDHLRIELPAPLLLDLSQGLGE